MNPKIEHTSYGLQTQRHVIITSIMATLEVDPASAFQALSDSPESALDVISEGPAQYVGTLAVLSIAGAAAFVSEQLHYSQTLPQPAQAIAESVAHLPLGYAAGWLAGIAVQRGWFNRRLPFTAGLTVAINFLVEESQDIILQASGNEHWWAQAQWYESTKDLSFAALAAVGFGVQAKLRHRRARHRSVDIATIEP